MLSPQQLEKLKKFKWNESDYVKSKNELKNLGYTEVQIERIILRKSSRNIVEAIIRLHNALIHNGFNHKQITEISSRGGAYNLDAVIAEKEALRGLGFTDYQIVRMVSHIGGSKNLEAVIENRRILKDFEFNDDQIVRMVSHIGGSKNLEAVIENRRILKDFEFNDDQIVRMVSHDGGSKNLKAVITKKEILRDLGFTNDQIVRTVSSGGGAKNLETVVEKKETLRDLGFTNDQIVHMVSHHGGSKNLKTVIAKKEILRDLGFTNEQIVLIVSCTGGSKKLEAAIAAEQVKSASTNVLPTVGEINDLVSSVFNNSDEFDAQEYPEKQELTEFFGTSHREQNFEQIAFPYYESEDRLRFSNPNVIETVQRSMEQESELALKEKLNKLKWIESDYVKSKNELKNLGYTEVQADKIILRKSSRNTVGTVIRLHNALILNEFNHRQITEISSRKGGSNNLKAVIANRQILKDFQFNDDQIVRMVSHDGGSNNLRAVIANRQILKDFQFNDDQIVRMVSHDGGSNNLKAITAKKEILRDLRFTPLKIMSIVSCAGGSKKLEAAIAAEQKQLSNLEQGFEEIGSFDFLELLTQNRRLLVSDEIPIYSNNDFIPNESEDRLRFSNSNVIETLQRGMDQESEINDLVSFVFSDRNEFSTQEYAEKQELTGFFRSSHLNHHFDQIDSFYYESEDRSPFFNPNVIETVEKEKEIDGLVPPVYSDITPNSTLVSDEVSIYSNSDLNESEDRLQRGMEQKSELAIKEKLKKLNWSESDYVERKNDLKNLGYTEVQADKIILRRFSKKTVETIIQLHNALIDKGFNRDQITRMSSRGSACNLDAVIKKKETLSGLGFTNDQIVRMVSYDGGPNNLQTVIEKKPILEDFKFSDDQIVQMVSHSGGSNNLDTVIANREMLIEFGFDNKQIVQMVSFDGGSNNLKAVIAKKEMLKDLRFTPFKIARIVSCNGGSKKLEAAIAAQVGSESANVEPIIIGEEGSKNLEVVGESTYQESEINDLVSSVFNDRDEFDTQEYPEKQELTGFFGSPHLEQNSDQIDFSNSNIIEIVEKEKEINGFNVLSFFNDSDELDTQSDQVESSYYPLESPTQNSISPLLYFYSPRQLENDYEITEEQHVELESEAIFGELTSHPNKFYMRG